MGWKPSNRLLAMLSSLPLLSASLFAWISGNPFNGGLLLMAGGLLLFWGSRLDTMPAAPAKGWLRPVGAAVVVFGLVYPHFLEAPSYFSYLYAAPVGLIPCPSLSAVIGLALLFNGYHAVKWPSTLAGVGLFYGVVGVFRLGVQLDWVLLAGALSLLLSCRVWQKQQAPVHI